MKPEDYILNTDELGSRYFERRDTFTKSRREGEDEEFRGHEVGCTKSKVLLS